LSQYASSVQDPPKSFGLAPTFEAIQVVRSPAPQSKLKAILLAIVVVCFNAVGNLSLAWGMKHISDVGVNPLGYVHAMLNPFVACGIVLLALWLLTRMALMSWADLSFVLPLMAIGYIVAAILGRFVLHEQVGLPQWFGTFLIFGGSVLVGTTHHRSGE
jgi:drug/metabolite transporter (DMT)-like permease